MGNGNCGPGSIVVGLERDDIDNLAYAARCNGCDLYVPLGTKEPNTTMKKLHTLGWAKGTYDNSQKHYKWYCPECKHTATNNVPL